MKNIHTTFWVIRLLRNYFPILLCVISYRLFAQQDRSNDFPDNHFTNFTTADGLPSNLIYAITIDKDGFVWIGTNNGLARYDGQRFTPFNALTGRANLPIKTIRAAFADSYGSLWLRFEDQTAYVVDLHDYSVRHLTEDFWQHDDSFHPTFIEDKTGTIWFSVSKGIVKYTHLDKKYVLYPLNEPDGKKVIRICKGSQGNYFWVATRKGIYRFDLDTHTFTKEQPLIPFTEKTRTIETDDAGNLWFSNWYDDKIGIVCYDPQKQQIIRQFRKEQISPTANTDAWKIQFVGGKIWFATNSGGILIYDTAQNHFKAYTQDPKNPFSIQAKQVVHIQPDKEGNIWFGTINGLHLFKAHRKKVPLLAYNPFDKNSLNSPIATSAFQLDERRMVLGTQFGLSIYDRLNKSFKNIDLPLYNGNHYNNVINTIASGANGSFWVGTWSGLFQLDKNTGRILSYYITFVNAGQNHPESIKRLNVKAIAKLYRDKKGFLWLINEENELLRIEEQRQPHVFEKMSPILPIDGKPYKPKCFLEYGDHYLLLGTNNGIMQYDYTTKTFQLLPISYPNTPEQDGTKDGTRSIGDLSLSKTGLLLAVINNKPFKIDLNTRQALPLRALDGQKYWQITEDTEEGIWLNTENGLFRTDLNGQLAAFFDAKNYLNDNTFQISFQYQMAKDVEGNLYFGGSKGFSVINPKEMRYAAPAPVVKITSIKYNNQPIPLEQAIHTTSSISLPYDQRSFSLEFAALGSTIPQLNQFAYRFDKDNWIDLGNQNTVNFSNLESGTYVLQVKAANSDGVWNDEGTRLTITIRPPWYNSWLAWLLYIGIIGYGIYYYYQYLRRQEMAQAETVRLKELGEFKSRFFTNITHEFRTPLTVILGSAEQMESKVTADLKSKVGLIRRNGQNLLRLINQILDLSKLESDALKINYLQGDLLPYLRYITESLHSVANAQNVLLRVESSEAQIVMDYDAERLSQIVYNLLSNAIKFTPSGGKIVLRADRDPSVKKPFLRLTVSDTGAGIPEADLPKVFDRFYQAENQAIRKVGGTGIGLSLTKELVKALGGTIFVESTIGKGTTFSVLLPITNLTKNTEGSPSDDVVTLEAFKTASFEKMPSVNSDQPTLLIIEDNPDIIEYLIACLGNNYQLDYAYNGKAGIEKALETVPDLIISDVMMPEKDGFEVCDFLKNDERTSHIPIVLLTAKADIENRIIGLKRGADAYLAKPFHQEELAVTLANLLALRRKLQVKYGDSLLVMDTPSLNLSTIESPNLEDVFLTKLRLCIEENMHNPTLDVGHLAQAMTLSESQLYRKVKALTDKSTVLYIRSLRLQKAYTLLQNSSLNVSEIAYQVGFNDPNYFSRAFQQEFGQSPSSFRN